MLTRQTPRLAGPTGPSGPGGPIGRTGDKLVDGAEIGHLTLVNLAGRARPCTGGFLVGCSYKLEGHVWNA